jgi:hypothetical protein
MDPETVAAETAAGDSKADKPTEAAPKPTTAEIVAAARAGRATPAAKEPSTEAPGAKPSEAEKKDGDEPKFYTPEEYATLDLRTADMSKVQPELRATFTAMQKAERAKHEKLNRELKALEAKKTPTATKEEPEEEQLFTDEEIDKMLGSKKGQAKLDKWAADRGLDFEQLRADSGQRLIQNAVLDVTPKHPELKDDTFFDETADAIAKDPEWSEAFSSNSGNRKILGLIFDAAAASVKLARAASKAAEATKAKEAEDKKKAAIVDKKVIANARSTVTALPSRKSASGDALSTLEIVKQVRAARRSSV